MTPQLLYTLVLLTLPVATLEQQAPGRLTFSATLESIKVDVRPHDVVTRQFRLTLDPGQPTTRFRAQVVDWWRSEDGARSHYAPPGTISRSCARWVSVNPVDSIVEAGVGVNGTLSRNWEDVFHGVENAANGEVTLAWELSPPPPGLASGPHTVTLRWRLRAVNP